MKKFKPFITWGERPSSISSEGGMKKIKLILASLVIIGAVLLVAGSSPPAQKAQAAETHLTQCGTLSQANTTYILDNDLTVTDNCFNISADNITFDGQNHSITATISNSVSINRDYSVIRMISSNSTVRNFNLSITGISSSATGIYSGGLNNIIDTNHIDIIGYFANAISLGQTTTVSNNVINNTGYYSQGINQFYNIQSMEVFGNKIITRKQPPGQMAYTSNISVMGLTSCNVHNNTLIGYDDGVGSDLMMIRGEFVSRCLIHDNMITGEGPNVRGIYLAELNSHTGVDENQIYNNNINISGGANNPAIRVRTQIGSKFYNNSITTGAQGFYIGESSGTIFDKNEIYGNCINSPTQFYYLPYTGTNDIHDNVCVIALTKTVDKTSAGSGETLTYTINYTNNSSDTYTNARIEDPIPNGTTYIQGSATGGATFDGSKIILNIGNLAAGASGNIQFQVRVE